MKLPTRKLPARKMTDAEFEAKTIADSDKAVAVVKAAEEKELADMGLAPVQKAEVLPHVQSPTESRVESVNSLLASAYAKASQLDLSEDEIKKLSADFPDSDFYRGAAGKDDLIYIQHSALRLRLNQAIGLGKWAMIVRRSWSEEFLTSKKEKAVRVYVEGVLMIRGCYVGEAIGDMVYYPNNASQCYGDAHEGAKTAAFRRCMKDMGIGLQAFDKDYCSAWKEKYRGFSRPEK